jgi:hypothetical protein
MVGMVTSELADSTGAALRLLGLVDPVAAKVGWFELELASYRVVRGAWHPRRSAARSMRPCRSSTFETAACSGTGTSMSTDEGQAPRVSTWRIWSTAHRSSPPSFGDRASLSGAMSDARASRLRRGAALDGSRLDVGGGDLLTRWWAAVASGSINFRSSAHPARRGRRTLRHQSERAGSGGCRRRRTHACDRRAPSSCGQDDPAWPGGARRRPPHM